MAECKDCIHFCVCSPYTSPNESYPEVGGCKCFKATTDVVPKSEVEQLQHKYDLAVAEREANVKGFAEELSKAKSEVDLYRKQVDELEDELAQTYDKLEKAKADVAREIFAEIEKALYENKFKGGSCFLNDFAELKKKYT